MEAKTALKFVLFNTVLKIKSWKTSMCVMDLACFFFPRHSQWWGITGTAPHCSAPAIPAQPMHSEFLIYNPSSALIKVVFNTLLLFHDCSCSIFTVTPYIWSTLLLQQQGKKKRQIASNPPSAHERAQCEIFSHNVLLGQCPVLTLRRVRAVNAEAETMFMSVIIYNGLYSSTFWFC